jgi:hypothetical protein
MRSMTDEGYGVSHPTLPLAEASESSLRDTPHPTLAHARATFSRKGRRNWGAHPQSTLANQSLTYSSAKTGTSICFFIAQATGCWCSGMK